MMTFWDRVFHWHAYKYRLMEVAQRYAEARIESAMYEKEHPTPSRTVGNLTIMDARTDPAFRKSCELYGELLDALGI